MNNHDNIRTLLAAYCGNDLDKAERSRIEEHLAGCAICRAELKDLQTTLRLIKTTPEIEPPPWLATRVMARVREQQREKRNWLQRFFLPLHVKLPFEFAALLLVCISGYYMARTMETELPQPGIRREETVLAPPQINTHTDAGTPKASAPKIPAPTPSAPAVREETGTKPETAAPARQSAPPQLPKYDEAPPQPRVFGISSQVMKEERATLAKPSAESAPAPVMLQSERAAKHAKKAKSAVAGETTRLDSAGAASSQKAAGSAPDLNVTVVRVRMKFTTPAEAPTTLREMIARSGGSLIEERSGQPNRIKARLHSPRLRELLDHLERLGKIVDRPQQPDTTGIIEIEISW
jgi:anti-sigma factor RsiW